MTFDRVWVLFFTLAPVAWAAREWPTTVRRGPLLLKTGAFLAIIIALAQPRTTFFDTKVALAILADTSRSVTPQDLEHASAITTQIERARGRHWTELIPFARSTRKPTARERGKSWNLQITAGDAGLGTDLE